MKYFVLGAFSSAFLLYGIAMIYGATGSTNFINIRNFFATPPRTAPPLATCPSTTACCCSAWCWCWSAWASRWRPSRSTRGAPTSTTARPPRRWPSWPALVKAGAFAAFIRVFVLTFPNYVSDWRPILWVLAALSLLGGAVLGIVQTNIKRALAYSSINHVGFILLAVSAANGPGTSGRAVLRGRLHLHGGRRLRRGGHGGRQGRRAHHASRTTAAWPGPTRCWPARSPCSCCPWPASRSPPASSPSSWPSTRCSTTTPTGWPSWPCCRAPSPPSCTCASWSSCTWAAEDEEPAVRRVRVALGTKVAIWLCLLVTIGVGIFPELFDGPADHGVPLPGGTPGCPPPRRWASRPCPTRRAPAPSPDRGRRPRPWRARWAIS